MQTTTYSSAGITRTSWELASHQKAVQVRLVHPAATRRVPDLHELEQIALPLVLMPAGIHLVNNANDENLVLARTPAGTRLVDNGNRDIHLNELLCMIVPMGRSVVGGR